MFPFKDYIITLKDGLSKGFMVKSESTIEGKKARVFKQDYTQAINVGVNQTVSIVIQPPHGEMWSIDSLHALLRAPSNKTSGSAFLRIGRGLNYSDSRQVLYGRSSGGLEIIGTTFKSGTTSELQPSNEIIFDQFLRSLSVTNETPIVFTYDNRFDVASSTNFELEIIWEVEYIV